MSAPVVLVILLVCAIAWFGFVRPRLRGGPSRGDQGAGGDAAYSDSPRDQDGDAGGGEGGSDGGGDGGGD